MESDSVRTIGDSTLVDMWIDGKLRAVSVSREAIVAYLQLSSGRAAAMSDDERREFVRKNLTLVAKAATDLLRSMDPAADSVSIEAGQLTSRANVRTADRSSERRHGDRRRGDRRQKNLGPPPSGERRR
jgi:hypothetical protein